MFDLPTGYFAQPSARHERGFLSYEFNRVYDPRLRLDPGLSFWLSTPTQAVDGSPPRKLSFKDYAAAQGKAALSFDDFAAAGSSLDQIESWLARKTG